jgi:hypothetical protein
VWFPLSLVRGYSEDLCVRMLIANSQTERSSVKARAIVMGAVMREVDQPEGPPDRAPMQ